MNRSYAYVITFLFILMSASIITAQQEDVRFYHERATNLTIFEKCRVDGGICDSSFSCSLTVLTPSQELLVNNETMIDGGVYWNFTLNESETSVNGLYESTVDCLNASNAGSDTFFYEVTPNGSAPIDQGQGLILIGSVIVLVVISLFFAFLGFRSVNVTVSISFIALSLLLVVFTLGLIVNVIELSFGTFSGVVGSYSTIFVLFTVLLSVGMLGLILYLVYIALNYYWNLRGMRDTFSIDP